MRPSHAGHSPIRPAVPVAEPGADRAGCWAARVVDILALATSALTPLAWLAALPGGWLVITGRRGPDDTSASAGGVWLLLTVPTALVVTTTAALTLWARGSVRAAVVFAGIAVAGLTATSQLWW